MEQTDNQAKTSSLPQDADWNWYQSPAGTHCNLVFLHCKTVWNLSILIISVLSIVWIQNKCLVGQNFSSSFSISGPLDPIPRLVVKTSFRSGIERLVSGLNLVIIWSYRPPPISNRSSPYYPPSRATDHQEGSQAKLGGFNGRVGRWTGERVFVG